MTTKITKTTVTEEYLFPKSIHYKKTIRNLNGEKLIEFDDNCQ